MSRGMRVEQMTAGPAARPSQAERRLSLWLEKLFAAAAQGQQYGAAWASLAELLGASSVQLLRNIPPALQRSSVPVHAFDRSIGNGLLGQALQRAGAEHGLYAFVQDTSDGADILLAVRSGAPFTPAECSWVELVIGQVRAALELGDRLASPYPTTASAAHLVQLFPVPCALVDTAARCIEHSDDFSRMRESFSGCLRSGRIGFKDSFMQACWDEALLAAHATATPQTFVADAPGGGRWKVHLAPLRCRKANDDSTPVCLIFVLFQNLGTAPITTLRSTAPLTKAELEVLAELLHGDTAKAIARTRGASVNTVRSQIAAILGKTGHHTQKQLIASFSTSSFEDMAPGHCGRESH